MCIIISLQLTLKHIVADGIALFIRVDFGHVVSWMKNIFLLYICVGLEIGTPIILSLYHMHLTTLCETLTMKELAAFCVPTDLCCTFVSS